MAFTKIAAAGIGSTGTVTLENVIITGTLNVPTITGTASTAIINSDSLTVSGVSTFAGNVKVGSAVTVYASSGIVSATKYYGDGSSLTGIDATSLKDSGGNIKVQANSSGVVVTGVATATSFSGSGSGLTGVSTNFVSAVGIQSAGNVIGAGITQLNFIGLGNTFAVNGTTVDISIDSGSPALMVIPTRSGTAVTFTIPSGGDLQVIARSGTVNVPV